MLNGWKKMVLGLVLIVAGLYLIATGDKETGMTLILTGAALFGIGNIADKMIKDGRR